MNDSAIPVLSARGVVKHYGHVQALRGADLDVRRAEVVALVGDNGAGKSTLIKIASGTLRADGGEIRFEGGQVVIDSPTAARRLGIETVYQDLALAPDLDPAANLFLGRELRRSGALGRLGFLDRRAMRERARESFASLGIELAGLDEEVASLSGGQQQAVAVSRAVAWASRIIFLDEPTAALGVVQARKVLDLIRRVRDAGRSVLLITHNLPHVFEVSDRIEVLRLGRRVASFTTSDTDMSEVVAAITGARVQEGEGS